MIKTLIIISALLLFVACAEVAPTPTHTPVPASPLLDASPVPTIASPASFPVPTLSVPTLTRVPTLPTASPSPIPTLAAQAVGPTDSIPATVPMRTSPSTANIPEFPKYAGADMGGPLIDAGTYRTPNWFSIPLAFTTHKLFRGTGEDLATGELFSLTQGSAYLPEKSLTFIAVNPKLTAEYVLDRLRQTRKAISGENHPIEISGIAGTTFDLASLPTSAQQNGSGTTGAGIAIPAIGPFVGHVGNPWRLTTSEARARFIVLTVKGRVLLIDIEAPKEAFDAFAQDADRVLATLFFIE